MGKGLSPDNAAFDATRGAEPESTQYSSATSKAMSLTSVGDTEYFIDGGGGGTPYALREVGTDTGYYYGFRVLRLFPSDGTDGTSGPISCPLVDSHRGRGPDDR